MREYNFHDNIYKVDKYGNVYGISNKIIKQKTNKDGYLEVELQGKKVNKNGNKIRYKVKVHAIVAKSFICKPGNVKIYEVNHKDCNRKNNNVDNLEWLTHYDNVKYSIEKGYHKNPLCIGEDNNKSKLLEKDILFIRKLFLEGNTIREIYRKFYLDIVSENTIGHICKRKTWKHI